MLAKDSTRKQSFWGSFKEHNVKILVYNNTNKIIGDLMVVFEDKKLSGPYDEINYCNTNDDEIINNINNILNV